jgi:hypothetical protein
VDQGQANLAEFDLSDVHKLGKPLSDYACALVGLSALGFGGSIQQEVKAGCLDLCLPSWYKVLHIPTGSSFPSSVFLKTCGRLKLNS